MEIYDKGSETIDTHHTVEIGVRILNGVFGVAFDDTKIDVSVGDRWMRS